MTERIDRIFIGTCWLAVGALGCGADEPASPPTLADVAYLVAVEGVRAHHTAALELLDKGAAEEAAPHLAHPVAELLPALRAPLADTFDEVSADLEADMRAVPRVFTEGGSRDELAAGIAVVSESLDRAVRLVVGDAVESDAAGAATAAALLSMAEALATASIGEGGVARPAQYEDAWGYLQRAAQLAAPFDVASELEALRAQLPSVLPADAPDTAAIHDAVAGACAVFAAAASGLVQCETPPP